MHKDFYIFRHGETDYNLAGCWQGQSIDAPLNTTGISQAENLAQRTKNFGLQIIYSSPLQRAIQTAECVAKVNDIKVKILPELIEASVGICEGMHRDDVAKQYPDIWVKWYGAMDMVDRWPGGESKLEIQQRMMSGFEKMLKLPETIIGVASHGGAMRYFLYAFGYGPHKMPNTALFHLIYDNGDWSLEQL